MRIPEKLPNEVIDALTCCGAGDVDACGRCPYNDIKVPRDCSEELCLDAASYIRAFIDIDVVTKQEMARVCLDILKKIQDVGIKEICELIKKEE